MEFGYGPQFQQQYQPQEQQVSQQEAQPQKERGLFTGLSTFISENLALVLVILVAFIAIIAYFSRSTKKEDEGKKESKEKHVHFEDEIDRYDVENPPPRKPKRGEGRVMAHSAPPPDSRDSIKAAPDFIPPDAREGVVKEDVSTGGMRPEAEREERIRREAREGQSLYDGSTNPEEVQESKGKKKKNVQHRGNTGSGFLPNGGGGGKQFSGAGKIPKPSAREVAEAKASLFNAPGVEDYSDDDEGDY